MLRPFHKITIGDNFFDFVTNGSFDSSWRTMTDTASLVLPHRFKKEGKTIYAGEDSFFKKGDNVEVLTGYYPNIGPIFEGYVTKIIPGVPVEIKMEDPAWLLKQNNLTMSFKSVTLETLVNKSLEEAKKKSSGRVLEGLKKIKTHVVDAKLGAFRITNVNMIGILDELKKTYALTSYMRGHDLYVGLAYNGSGKRVSFEFEKDIITEGTNLEYLKKDDVAFKIKAVSMLENNTKIEIEIGDPNGEQRTITKYNLSEGELRRVAKREAERLRYEGFRGQITTFLQPIMKHGDEVELIDKKRPDRNGVYLVESVMATIGIDGSFQTLKLGAKIGN